ncbi:hypothetical protein [Vreelandella maris]|uniref:Uncharacterized protein n=1 Tax=Vreelandella maris TaxID=2729617 RepID=A0A7Y6VAS9_9GAMM|nr:hypothetical protein [Halomonas maris]NVF16245.1 hypothetical protein [Halomonas maris]|tara:strand:+ start:1218 stop:1568 length:351 start_codon:yes stop_codon:yes gene_type:complete
MQRITTILLILVSSALGWNVWQNHTLKTDLALERSALSQMVDKRDAWKQKANEVADELGYAERSRRLAEADLKALQEELAEQAEDYDVLRRRIQESPASDDGEVAPVLRSTLEALP